MKNFYITFGQIHVHSVNGKTFDKDCVAVVKTKNMKAARIIAFEKFNAKFHHCLETKPNMSFFPRGFVALDE